MRLFKQIQANSWSEKETLSGRTGLGSQPEPGPDFGFSIRTETDGRDLTTTPKLTPTLDTNT